MFATALALDVKYSCNLQINVQVIHELNQPLALDLERLHHRIWVESFGT